jgi:hypothetical protein
MHSCVYCQQTFAKKSQLMEHHRLNKHHVQQSAFATWKEAVVVVFSLVSIEIFLSSKTLLACSTGKGIVVFVETVVLH